jgi:hypothetical protein
MNYLIANSHPGNQVIPVIHNDMGKSDKKRKINTEF